MKALSEIPFDDSGTLLFGDVQVVDPHREVSEPPVRLPFRSVEGLEALLHYCSATYPSSLCRIVPSGDRDEFVEYKYRWKLWTPGSEKLPGGHWAWLSHGLRLFANRIAPKPGDVSVPKELPQGAESLCSEWESSIERSGLTVLLLNRAKLESIEIEDRETSSAGLRFEFSMPHLSPWEVWALDHNYSLDLALGRVRGEEPEDDPQAALSSSPKGSRFTRSI